MKILFGLVANSSSESFTLPVLNECPHCKSKNVKFIGKRFKDDILYLKYECIGCDGVWEDEFAFRAHRIINNDITKTLIIELTNGKRDACGDCEMVAKMLAGELREELEMEYDHEMPRYYFEE